jgi:hypothetical protein
MSLLKNSPAGVQRIGTGNEGLTDQLEQLRNLVKMIKGLFDEREAHIAQMSDLVFSQHQAVMRIVSSPQGQMQGNEEIVANSKDNARKARAILAEEKKAKDMLR